MKNSDNLLKAYPLSKHLNLRNKIVMAPMTRAKAQADGTPTAAMVDYYARRADSGLIITEGTIIHPEGTGYHNVPGIYTEKQIEYWQNVTAAVHAKAGKIFLQIWHVGRVSHPHFLHGKLPISASATTMQGRISRSKDLHYGQSRAATAEEIPLLVEQYAQAAKSAIRAGFDGVEIHGANGYLIDQFLHYDTNLRIDNYGGNAQAMSRFALEVVQACSDAIGSSRLGIRLSPAGYLHDVTPDIRDAGVFAYLLKELSKLQIAYVHTGNFDDSVKFAALHDLTMTAFIRQHYTGTVIACGGYSLADAEEQIAQQKFDLVAIGKPFIANPDLIDKYQRDVPLTAYDRSMLDTLN